MSALLLNLKTQISKDDKPATLLTKKHESRSTNHTQN